MQNAYLILSSSLLVRAAIIFAHAHILRYIGSLAFALPRSDGLSGIGHAAAMGRVGAAHDEDDRALTERGSGVLAQGLRYLMICGGMLKGDERAVKKGRSSRTKREGKDVWSRGVV